MFEDKELLYKTYSADNVFVCREATQLDTQSSVCTALLHSFGCFQAFLISISFSRHKFWNTCLDLFARLSLTKPISTVQICEALEISNITKIKLDPLFFFFFKRKSFQKGWNFSLWSTYPAGTETARDKWKEINRLLEPNRLNLTAELPIQDNFYFKIDNRLPSPRR